MPKYFKQKITDEDIAKMHIKNMETKDLLQVLDFIDALKEWRSKVKLHSTYYSGIKKALNNTGNGKIYFDYNIRGTVTGRLSCGSLKANKKREGEEDEETV